MKLNEVFEHLQYGELSNLGLVDKATGIIPQTSYPKILSSVNLGVMELHKRFVLKKGILRINLLPGRTMYPLLKKHQIGNKAPVGTDQYIQNDGVVFDDDLIKLEKVFTEKGVALGLNDSTARYSVSTPQDNVLYVSSLLRDTVKPVPSVLTLEYRKGVKPIKVCEWDGEELCNTVVDIPHTHLMALLYFVASRLHNPIGFSEATTHEGNNYWAKFEGECLSLDFHNLRVDEVVQNDRARRNGWP